MDVADKRATPKAALEHYRHMRLKPGLQAQEIAKLFTALPAAIPVELTELLMYASGFSSPDFGAVDFTGRSLQFSFDEISPFGIPIASRDGNTWVIDIQSDGASTYVLYFSHDPPVVIIQFDSLAEFIDAVGNQHDVAGAANIAASQVYKTGASGISVAEARRSRDTDIAKFAENLPGNLSVFDLRKRSPLRGFAWGRTGPNAECRRAGTNLIFAATVK